MNTLHLRRTLFAFTVAAMAVTALPLAAAPATDGPVADVHLGTTQVQWAPKADFAGLRLTVAGPNGTEQFAFGPGESPLLDLASVVADIEGQYSWELRAIPQVNVQQISAAARTPGFEAGDRQRPAGLPAAADLVQSGTFTVSGGAIVQPLAEPRTELQVEGAGGSNKVTGDLGFITAELVHTEDVSIIGSLCVGLDCVSSENFGFDTIRMKENNTRLAFTDTSNSGSFPSNDWTIVANDSFNGGASYLAFQDDETGRLPFRVEAAARANALVVEADGHIGIGALNPAVNIHVVEGNTPALRLEQDGSSGFTPHIWDVAGNEANFFVRNVTNASALAFRIKPGSGTSNALVIDGDGDIGMGTDSPDHKLHLVEAGAVIYRLENTVAGTQWDATNDGNGDFALTLVGTGGSDFEIEQDGDIGNCGNPDHDFVISIGPGCAATPRSWIDAGDTSFSTSSSRTYKENLVPIEVESILDKVRQIPVYKYDFVNGPNNRIGLMAEDFHQIFGRGLDTELSGHEMQVALWLAVQELTATTEELRARDRQIEELLKRVEALARGQAGGMARD